MMWRRDTRSFVISKKGMGGGGGREGPSSSLNVEVMILLSGHGARNPKQKVQAEYCRVKAIRWFSFTEGY